MDWKEKDRVLSGARTSRRIAASFNEAAELAPARVDKIKNRADNRAE